MQRSIDGHGGLFPDVTDRSDQMLASTKKLVGIYNDALAEDIERVEVLCMETQW